MVKSPIASNPKGAVINYGKGGGYKTGGGSEVLPIQKGGGVGRKSLSHAEGGGGHKTF